MGLSDGERTKHLYWACLRISDLGRQLSGDTYPREMKYLKDLCARIWVDFLGSSSNGMHWIAGSSATNDLREPDSPWSVGLLHRMAESLRPEPRRREKFDPFDGFLDIPGLLSHGGDKDNAHIYNIFAWTEQAIYALRRYNDNYLRRRQGLSDLLARIQGECFAFFAKSDDFAKAYVHYHTLKMLYGTEWNPTDIRPIMQKQNWHHYLSRPMSGWVSLRQFRAWHYRTTVAETTTERILVGMDIMGRRYHYKHQIRALCKWCRESGLKVDYKAIWKQFQKCEADHKDDAEGGMEDRQLERRREAFSAIHGYDSWEYDSKCPKPFDDALFREEGEGDEE